MPDMGINEMAAAAHANAVAHGFHDAYRDIEVVLHAHAPELVRTYRVHAGLARLMLRVTELSEAAEAVRKDDRANFEEELADDFIRAGDDAAALGIDVAAAVRAKMAVNAARPMMHGKLA